MVSMLDISLLAGVYSLLIFATHRDILSEWKDNLWPSKTSATVVDTQELRMKTLQNQNRGPALFSVKGGFGKREEKNATKSNYTRSSNSGTRSADTASPALAHGNELGIDTNDISVGSLSAPEHAHQSDSLRSPSRSPKSLQSAEQLQQQFNQPYQTAKRTPSSISSRVLPYSKLKDGGDKDEDNKLSTPPPPMPLSPISPGTQKPPVTTISTSSVV
jgi:hypothetical protein